MPQTDPNLNLQYGWTLGESGWNAGMDANLKKLGAVVHLSVKSRTVSAPPTSPVNGDRYIIPSGATGDWAGRDGQIAVRVGGVWEYYTAAVGWVAYVEDENRQVIYTAQGWTLVDYTQGLGTMAMQNADDVNITGGSINNITLGGYVQAPAIFERLGVGGANYFSGTIRCTGEASGNTEIYGIIVDKSVQPDVTSGFSGCRTQINVVDTQFTINSLRHFYATQGSFGTNATVNTQYGFAVSSNLTGANTNFGFLSSISAGAGRWNFYASGTAENFFKGRTTFNTGFARTPTVSTAPDGSTITLTSATNHLLYNNASTVASLTINLPTNDVADGQEITIATRSAVTALTVSAGNAPIYGAPTTLPAGGFATFIYSSVAGAWFRKG